jgi:hypothetical protein
MTSAFTDDVQQSIFNNLMDDIYHEYADGISDRNWFNLMQEYLNQKGYCITEGDFNEDDMDEDDDEPDLSEMLEEN